MILQDINDFAIRCANCGQIGHVYKICKYPISSFGVICYRKCKNEQIEYLMVQRKFSLCFVEFVRGNYSLQNRSYILRLFANMTTDERTSLLRGPFRRIWDSFWQTNESVISACFIREYNKSLYQYSQLRVGYWLRNPALPNQFFSLSRAIIDTHVVHKEPEWGFPKGRRNINESDIDCARREFVEETTIDIRDVSFLDMQPVEETFFGMNRVNYRHTYYVATVPNTVITGSTCDIGPKGDCETRAQHQHQWSDDTGITYRTDTPIIDRSMHPPNKVSCDYTRTWKVCGHEIRSIRWFSADGVRSKIRKENSARLSMFDTLNYRLQSML